MLFSIASTTTTASCRLTTCSQRQRCYQLSFGFTDRWIDEEISTQSALRPLDAERVGCGPATDLPCTEPGVGLGQADKALQHADGGPGVCAILRPAQCLVEGLEHRPSL